MRSQPFSAVQAIAVIKNGVKLLNIEGVVCKKSQMHPKFRIFFLVER